MDYPALLNLLRNHPKSFLRDHYLKIWVPQNSLSGQSQYYFGGKSDGTPGGVRRRGEGLFTRGSKVLQIYPDTMRGDLAPNNIGAPVFVVPTHSSLTVNRFDEMNGIYVVGGADIMITTLLNGCTFCCAYRQNGGVVMKHIQPQGGYEGTNNGTLLAQRIGSTGPYNNRQRGAFLDQRPGTFRFFGASGGNDGYNQGTEDVTIVGVNRGGNWSVYAQTHPGGANATNIGRVIRFFPEE